MTAHKSIEIELKLANDHLRKAMAEALPINEPFHHELAQLVFAVGANLEGWQEMYSEQLTD